MGLVPVSPWVCLNCGLVAHNTIFAPDCCVEQFAIQVRVDVPGKGEPIPEGVIEEVES